MADISLVLTVDAKTGTATLKQVGDSLDQVDKKAKNAQGGLGGLSGTLSGLARNFLGAVSAMGALKVAFDALKAQDQAMQAVNSLNLALSNQGNLLPGVSARLQEYNAALQDRTAFEADAITQAQATLASFGMNEEAIKRTTAAALNFSAATGKDLPTSMELLGKAYAGNTASLSRYGIVLDESVPKSKRFEEALGQVEQRFAGFAEAQASSFSGGLAQAQNALGDTQEALGKFLGELAGADKPFGAVVSAARVMTDFFGRDLVIALGESRAQFAEFYASIVRDSAAFAEKVAGSGFLQGAINALGASTGLPLGSFAAGVGRESAADMRAFADGLDQAAVAIRAESDAAAIAVGKTLEFTNGLKQAGPAARDAAEAFKKAGDYVTDGLDIEKWWLGPERQRELVALADDAGRQAAEAFLAPQQLSLESQNLLYGQLYTNVAQIVPETIDWKDAVAGVGDAFAQVGQIASGVLGGIFSLFGRLISIMQSVGKGLGSILSGAAAAGSAVGQLAGASAGIGSGVGALAGPLILKGIGSVLAPGIGTAVGAVAGGLLGKLFGGLFGGKDKPEVIPPTWEEKFKTAADAVEKFGLAAGRGIRDLLGTAGNRRPEAQAFVNQQLGRATGAMGAIGGLDITSAAGAAAQATIFTTTFWAVVKEQGLVAGVDALSAPFAALKEKLSAGGFDVDALLGGVGGLFDAVEGPARAALDAADGLNQALQGVALAGYLTQDSFAAFGQSAQDAFNQALAGNLDSNQALLAIAPLLANIEEASRTYGLTIDANTQALIDQARNAGIAFPVDPIERAALAMERVAQHLERIYGLSENVGQSLSGWPTPGSGGVPSYHNPDYSAASGMYIPSLPRTSRPDGASVILAHPGEEVRITPAGRRGGGTTINMPINVTASGGIDRAAFQREMAEDIRREKVPELLNRITERVLLRLRVA